MLEWSLAALLPVLLPKCFSKLAVFRLDGLKHIVTEDYAQAAVSMPKCAPNVEHVALVNGNKDAHDGNVGDAFERFLASLPAHSIRTIECNSIEMGNRESIEATLKRLSKGKEDGLRVKYWKVEDEEAPAEIDTIRVSRVFRADEAEDKEEAYDVAVPTIVECATTPTLVERMYLTSLTLSDYSTNYSVALDDSMETLLSLLQSEI